MSFGLSVLRVESLALAQMVSPRVSLRESSLMNRVLTHAAACLNNLALSPLYGECFAIRTQLLECRYPCSHVDQL